ncbi:glycosyltransferase family 4 protein [Escherichia albertii]|uniref:glycosyltransferase family 4 protein n=1 Tax=Escherichia albertii TaxID=208962 RepID=UPI0030C9CB5A
MNILFLSNASGYGGSERTLEILANNIAKENKVTVFVENNIHRANLNKIGISTIESNKGKSIKTIVKDLLLIRHRMKINDGVIANTNKAALYIAILSFFLPKKDMKKCIVFVRDFQWRYCNFIFWRLQNAIICVASPAVKEYLREYNVNPLIIPNPIEVKNKKCTDNINENISENIILCPAMISRWKGLEYLVRAFALLDSHCQLYIIGKVVDETYYKFIKNEIDLLNLTQRVRFINFSSDISKYYERSTVIVNSSVSSFGGPETFGRTIIEAWSFKKPVVAFDCGGPKYLITNDVDGLLVKEKNVFRLACALQKILNDRNYSTMLGMNGYNKVLHKYNVDIISEVILNKLYHVR